MIGSWFRGKPIGGLTAFLAIVIIKNTFATIGRKDTYKPLFTAVSILLYMCDLINNTNPILSRKCHSSSASISELHTK